MKLFASQCFKAAPMMVAAMVLMSLICCGKVYKDIDDYFPVLSNTTATTQSDGSVLVTADIVSEGAATLEYVGFCTDTTANPEMLDNQIIGTIENGKITALYPANFQPYTTYYFRAWATNRYGWILSDATTQLDNIIPELVEPPCTLTPNRVSLGGGLAASEVTGVEIISSTSAGVKVQVFTLDGATLVFDFGSALTNGVYTTTKSTSPSAKLVQVTFYQDFISGTLEAESPVYVRTITPGVFDITICDAPWYLNQGGNPVYMKCRFTTP